LAITSFLVVITSLVVYDLERNAPHSTIHSWPDALWWAIVTVTTVGYGDKFPVTAGGRAVATVLMFSGIALFSVLTAALATFFVSRLRAQDGQANKHPRPADDDTWLSILDRLEAIEASLAGIANPPRTPSRDHRHHASASTPRNVRSTRRPQARPRGTS
jgi:voltage-gated potassium channel